MNKFKVVLSVLLLCVSLESSASLMQLTYDNFYAPPSPTNWPVDMTGSVSFVFDGAVEDADTNAFEGTFLNPIKSGFMFLSGIRYDIDTDAPVEFTTHFNTQSSWYSSFRATGTIFNIDLGRRDTFSMAFYGNYSEDIGDTLDLLDLQDSHSTFLNFGDGTFFESGSVSTEMVSANAEVASVPEPASLMLLMLGMAATLIFRTRNNKVADL
ncbi:MAG: PEP-CTERM sorting domain-containing protein [Pseudomonadota bacterium]